MRNNNLFKKEVLKCLWQVLGKVKHVVERNDQALTVLVRRSYDHRGGQRTAAAGDADGRAPQLRNHHRSPEIHYQIIPLRDALFPFLSLELIQNHSPGMYAPYKKPTYRNFRQWPMSNIG